MLCRADHVTKNGDTLYIYVADLLYFRDSLFFGRSVAIALLAIGRYNPF